jgi:hypothetical protein
MGQLKKEMSEGKITFNDVKQAMIDATSEGGRFYGMMNKQSETLEGKLSTLSDTWEQVGKSIGDVFLPMAKKAVEAMTAVGEATKKTIDWLNSEKSTLKGIKESWDKYWASKRHSKKTLTFTMEPYLNKTRAQQEVKKGIESASKGFAAMSSVGLDDSEAVKKAKKQKDALLAISKDYARQIADIESYETAKAELAGEGGKFQRNYTEKLQILQWYYNERYRIMEAANNNMSLAQEQFNQLEELKNQKMAQANISTWAEYGNSLKSILSGSFTTLLTTSGDFGDTMMSLMSNIYQSLLKLALDAAIKEINIATWKTAILTALNAFTGGIGGTAVGAVTGATPSIASLDTFHSGGLSTQEQLAVIRKDERVLNPAETSSYNSGQGGTSESGINNIMMFNIKAWDGKDVINTLKSNSQTINQIVASGIKNNNQGLRTTVQNI